MTEGQVTTTPRRGRITAGGLYNYHALAGDGSDTFRALNEGRSWRAALLGTVATGALWMMAPRPAKAGPAVCTTVGTTVTCTGDQSAGISSATDFNAATVDTLNVNSLTTNITPAAGTAGILFFRYGASDTVTINSNIAPYSFSTVTLPGITASAEGGVTINNTGDITSVGTVGISAISNNGGLGGAVTVINNGAIKASGFGISASGDAGVTVQQTGDLTVNGTGIRAISANGAVSVTNIGTLAATGTGIFARSSADTVYVKNSGSISSGGFGSSSIYATSALDIEVRSAGNLASASQTGRGIFAYSSAGAVAVTSSGAISGGGDGINASAAHGVTVQHTGDVTTTHAGTGSGIHAFSGQGAVNVGIVGNVNVYGDGIYARTVFGAGTSNIAVSATGDIASAHGRGIYASSQNGTTVSVTGTGNITAFGDGIYARNSFNNASAGVTVTHTGDITSTTGRGIYASAVNGASTVVTSNGNITAQDDGIYARATGGGGAVIVTHTGDITSNTANGIYTFGFGANSISVDGGTISGATAGIKVAFGVNIINVGSGATVTGGTDAILGGTSSDTVNNSGAVIGLTDLGLGANTINNFGTMTATGSVINAGSGNDTVNNSGTVTGDIDLGDGTNTISNFGMLTTHSGGIVTGAGNDTINNYGVLTADIDLGDGANTINNFGKMTALSAGIVTGAGNDTVTNRGTLIADIDLGDGTNTINNFGILTAQSGGIKAGAGDDTINNSGTITGNVDLSAGTNVFNNETGGIFNSGATVNLGAGNLLVNSGTLAPGGVGTIAVTNLTGNFVQNAGGLFVVDIDRAAGTADRLNVTGTASLAGTVVPNFMNIFGSGSQTFTILSAAGGATNNGFSMQNTAVVTYELTTPNATDVDLTLAVNFAPSGLTPNEQAVGQHLQQASVAGGGSLNSVLTYLATLDLGAYAANLDRLTPEPYLAQAQTALWSGFDFANSLFSCPQPSSQGSLMGEGSCYWLRPGGHEATLGGHDGFMGFTERTGGLTGGVQGEVTRNWYLDLGAGYARSSIGTNTSSASGNVFHGGAALKYMHNNWLVAGSVSGSLARYDTCRYGISTAGTATAQADTSTLDLRLRFAYAFGTSAFYVKPLVDFDAVKLWRGAIDESGAGALNLHVQSENGWVTSSAPAVEIGTQWQQGGYTWRPYVRAGVRFLSKDDFSATASFEGSPAGIAPFTVTSLVDQTLAEISTGFDVWKGKRYSLRLEYEGRFGRHTSENGGSLEVHAAF